MGLKKKREGSAGPCLKGHSLPSGRRPVIMEVEKDKKGTKIWSLRVLLMMI